MVFWIDADSCPRPVRRIVARRAGKLGFSCYFVSCRPLPVEEGAQLSLVPNEDQAADRHILSQLASDDLVITRDLGLAQKVLSAGASAMNDRGILWQADTLRERLSLALAAREIYTSGLEKRPTKSFGKREIDDFSGGFDRWVQGRIRGQERSGGAGPN